MVKETMNVNLDVKHDIELESKTQVLETSMQEIAKNIKDIINLDEQILGTDGEFLLGQNAKGDIIPLTYREVLKWVVSGMAYELHSNFDYLVLSNDLINILKNKEVKTYQPSNDEKQLLKPLIVSCKSITSLPKMELLKKMNLLK